jgi:excisionase family DNA binding protein
MQSQILSNWGQDVDLFNREHAAKRINCSQRHLHNLRLRGELPYVKLGKFIRFIPADLDAYVESHRIG